MIKELSTDTFSKGNFIVDCGMFVYDRSGNEFVLEAAVSATEWLVRPMMTLSGWEGEEYQEPADHCIFRNPEHLYPVVPVPVVHKEISEAEIRLKDIQRQIWETQSEFTKFNNDEKARKDRIARHDQLQLLDDWISGKIECLVEIGRGEYKILTKKDFESSESDNTRRPAVMKLLTLWGKSNGNLAWQLGQYSDDSGYKTEVKPFASYDEAVAYVKTLVERDFTEWSQNNTLAIHHAIKTCQTLNLPMPDDIIKYMKQTKIASAQRNADTARVKFEEATAALIAARKD